MSLKTKKNSEKRSNKITFIVPVAVPAVRTTQSMRHTSRQYKRYGIFGTVVALYYLEALSKSHLTLSEEQGRTWITYIRQLQTRYRDWLIQTIAPSRRANLAFIVVRVEDVTELQEKRNELSKILLEKFKKGELDVERDFKI